MREEKTCEYNDCLLRHGPLLHEINRLQNFLFEPILTDIHQMGLVEAEIAALDWHWQGQPVAIGLALPEPIRSAGAILEHYQR